MPNYDYKCSSCGHKVEIFHKIDETPSLNCPHCKAQGLQKLPGGSVGLSFIGDGFYKTMYGNSKEPAAPSSSSSSGTCCPCGKNKNSCSNSQ